MDFEWDLRKAAANRRKHGVIFEEASEVFADDHSSTVADPDHSVAEQRYLVFGGTLAGRALVVAFTERDAKIRIINARLMTRLERLAYEH